MLTKVTHTPSRGRDNPAVYKFLFGTSYKNTLQTTRLLQSKYSFDHSLYFGSNAEAKYAFKVHL